MPWKEVTAGRFEKALDTSEAFFWALNAAPKPPTRERWTCIAVAVFKSELPTEELSKLMRQGMKVMRYQHPAIAAILEKDKKVYVVPSDQELESWLDQSVVIEPFGADIDVVLGEYKSTPLLRLHYFPSTSEILVRTSHWRSDGVGLSIFMEDLFTVLADPHDVKFGDEGERLPPSMEEIAGVCEITPEKETKVKQRWGEILTAGRSVGLPIKMAIPGGTYRRTYVFSQPMTSAIIAACKKRSISFTTAIASSLVGVVQKNHPEEEGDKPTKYITFPFINLRQILSKSMGRRDHPFSVMVLNDPMILDVKDFDANAKQITPFYTKIMDPESGMETLSLASTWLDSSIKMVNPAPPPPNSEGAAAAPNNAKAQAPAQPALPIVSTPALNSLGVLDRYLKTEYPGKNNFEITDFWFGVEILGANLIIYAWTFRSKIRLTIYYNEAFYEVSYVQHILQELIDTLLGDLNVSWTSEAKL